MKAAVSPDREIASLSDILSGKLAIRVPKKGEPLGKFYIPYDFDYRKARHDFDQEGVCLFNADKLPIRGVKGVYYDPLMISQYALACFDRYLDTGDKKILQEGLAQGRWLVENQSLVGVWYQPFDHTRHGLKAPWIDPMTQGVATSALLRLYQETDAIAFFAAAQRAALPFTRSADQGGVRDTFRLNGTGLVFYEMLPGDKKLRILNHFIYSLFGLYDLYIATDWWPCYKLFTGGLDTLERVLPLYDTGFWSRYGLSRPTIENHFEWASPAYHLTHIAMLHVLHRMSGRELFKTYAERWQGYLKRPMAWLIKIVHGGYRLTTAMKSRWQSRRESRRE